MEEESHIKITFDSNGKPLEGDKNYKLQLPPNIPARNFWSVILYDIENHLIIKNGQAWPTVHSNSRQLLTNTDGSTDIWFGPQAPLDNENNWIQTIQGKKWYMMLNLYGLSETENNKAWKSGEIEQIENIQLK